MSEFSEALARLTAGYYNSSAVGVGNPGGLAEDGHVVNFPSALKDVGRVAEAMEAFIAIFGDENLGAATVLSDSLKKVVLSSSRVTFFVDQTSGNDGAAGTLEAPLQSIPEALSRVDQRANLEIRLLSDYTFQGRHNVNCRRLAVYGHPSEKVTVSHFWLPTSGGPIDYINVTGFLPESCDAIYWGNLKLALAPNPAGTVTNDKSGGLMHLNGNFSPAFFRSKFSQVDILPVNTGDHSNLFQMTATFVIAQFVSSTLPSNFEGRILEDANREGTVGVDPALWRHRIIHNLNII